MNHQIDKVLNSVELAEHSEQSTPAPSDAFANPQMADKQDLAHQSEASQVELGIHKKSLHETLVMAKEACFAIKSEHERYLELFDFAPIAYFKLGDNCIILKANFCAANLLGCDRSQLVGKDFSTFISNEHCSAFERFLAEIAISGIRQSCEIALQKSQEQCWVAIDAIANNIQKYYFMAVSDISERKNNEEYWRSNYAFITNILDSVEQKIIVLDRHGVILAVNNSWIDFCNENGFPNRSQSMIGSNYLDGHKNDSGHFFCEDAAKAYYGIQSVLSGKQSYFSMEYECHSDDQKRWFQMTASPLKYPRYGAVVSHENITKRKLAERLPNLVKALFDISMDGFFEIDFEGNLLNANDAYAKMSGYSLSELNTMHLSQLEAIENVESINAHIAKVVEQGYDRFETCHRHKDGHIIEIEIAAAYLSEFEQYSAFCRDISQRKQADAKLNAIFNATVEGIISFDLYDIIISANPSIEVIFGYKPEELIGRDINLVIPLLPKCSNGCSLSGTIKHTAQIFEFEGFHKDGRTLPLELTRTEYTINGSCFFVVIVRDVRLRKQREQQDKAHLDELAHITRLGLMGEMASSIAHEVNQPLAAIASYTQASINLSNSENCDLSELRKILFGIQQQALRAGQIIHRMREFIKSSPQHRSTIEINNLIREAVSLCNDDIKQNNIKMVFDFQNNLPPVSADHIQIEQVLINLFRNSIDALQTLPNNQLRQLNISTKLTEDDCIQVRVKDNGPGIDLDQQRKILTPFYTTKKTGMGMGLAISRSLIEAHNGNLRFKSTPGKGSTFFFTLPTRKEKHGD